MTEKYRFNNATSEVYEYNFADGSYVFIGNLNGKTEKQFIADLEYQRYKRLSDQD